jgi:hypothetical protein
MQNERKRKKEKDRVRVREQETESNYPKRAVRAEIASHPGAGKQENTAKSDS